MASPGFIGDDGLSKSPWHPRKLGPSRDRCSLPDLHGSSA